MKKRRHNNITATTSNIKEALRALLQQGTTGNQEEINHTLATLGYKVNQSKISRLLRKLGAVKTQDTMGNLSYCLPQEPTPSGPTTPITNLVVAVSANENLIIIQTSPGSASLIARLLDYNKKEIGILGTIAGDDTIFIAPQSIKTINKTLLAIKSLLFSAC